MALNSIILKVAGDKDLNVQLLEKMKEQLKNLPKGRLCMKIINQKEYWYYYIYDTSNQLKTKNREIQIYLPKENIELKYALQKRFFIERSIKHLKRNIAVATDFLSRYEPFIPSEIIDNSPKAYKDFELGSNENYIDIVANDYAQQLDSPSIEKKSFYSEGLSHCTSRGLKVRSKSESIIATLLDMNEIPYRYEAPLTLGDHTFYPDFTIMRPSDQRLFYWEHFGMMGNHDYCEKMQRKLQTYLKHGINPWDRLITTFESNEDTFDAQHIDKIIKILLL